MPCTPFFQYPYYSPFIIFSLCSLHTIFTCGGKARMAHACQAPFGSMTNHPHLPRAHHDSSATQGTLASDQFDFHGNHPLLMSLSLLSLSLAIITPHVSAIPPNPESEFVSIDVALDCEPVRNFKNSDAQFLPISSRLARPIFIPHVPADREHRPKTQTDLLQIAPPRMPSPAFYKPANPLERVKRTTWTPCVSFLHSGNNLMISY